MICFVNEVYNRIYKSYNIFHSALYTILLLKSYVMTLFNDSKLLSWRFNMILNLKYNYEKLLIHNILEIELSLNVCNWKGPKIKRKDDNCFFFHCVVRADARGNVNREQNKWHRAAVRLESGGTSFSRKLLSYGPDRGKVNRGYCIIGLLHWGH